MFCSPRTNTYWDPDAIGRLHKKILSAAGIDTPVRFHDLRHTFATMAIQNGVDVKTVASMLGHYSAAFTLDTYTHVTKEMQQGAAEKIGVFINSNIQINVNLIQQGEM
jgi:site-specific recombinase XerD